MKYTQEWFVHQTLKTCFWYQLKVFQIIIWLHIINYIFSDTNWRRTSWWGSKLETLWPDILDWREDKLSRSSEAQRRLEDTFHTDWSCELISINVFLYLHFFSISISCLLLITDELNQSASKMPSFINPNYFLGTSIKD